MDGPDEVEQDDREAANRAHNIGRGEAQGRELREICPGTGRAEPRPDTARAVSTARDSTAAASGPSATEVDHGGVADSPPGLVLL